MTKKRRVNKYFGDYECYVCEFNASNPPELNCPNCGSLQTLTELVTIRKSYLDDLQSELARLREELKNTDNLLKEATETIGAVVACCTYNSNEDAKIGIYGIDQKAFTKIDQFITRYNDAVSAGKVSVDVKRELSDAEINELGAQEAEKRDKK